MAEKPKSNEGKGGGVFVKEGKWIRLRFPFNGKKQHEEYYADWPVDVRKQDALVAQAKAFRADVIAAIKNPHVPFDYEHWFPNGALTKRRATAVEDQFFARVARTALAVERQTSGKVPKHYAELHSRIENSFIPHFGENTPISRITQDDIKALFRSSRFAGRSMTTKKNVKALLSTVFLYAIDMKYIDTNPCYKLDLKPPKARSSGSGRKAVAEAQAVDGTSTVKPYTKKEIGFIYDAIEQEAVNDFERRTLRNLFTLAIYTGMRTGEMLGLTWGDVEKIGTNLRIHVRRQAIKPGQFGAPKWNSFRFIDAPTVLKEALNDQRELTGDLPPAVVEYFFLPGNDEPGQWKKQSVKPVFVSSVTMQHYGGAHNFDAFNKRILPAAVVIAAKSKDKYFFDMTDRAFYQTRHTFASQMLSAGMDPSQASQMLGHKDPTLVLRSYGEYIPEDTPSKADYLDSLINKQEGM